MEKRFLSGLLAFLLTGLILTSCNNKSADFSFTFTMESVDNYKVALTVKSDKTYMIEEINYFHDNYAKKRDPKMVEGIFSEEEFEIVWEKIFDAGLFKMEDTYGFKNGKPDDFGNIMYQIYFGTGGKEKYISISYDKNNVYPLSFIELFNYLNEFISENRKK